MPFRRRDRPPPGWAPSSDPRAWSPVPAPPPARRRRRAATVLPWLVVLTIAAVYGSRWLPALGVEAPWLALVPASARDYPRPGVEEADARLAPAVVPATPGSSYAFLATEPDGAGAEAPVTWSPCRPIHVVVDPTGAPTDFADQVRAATAEIAAATGLTFADDGVVEEPADPDRAAFLPDRYGDRWAPVLVRFADAAAVPALAGDVVGIGGPQSVTDARGRMHHVTGAVYLDTDLLQPGATATAWPAVLRHELGHLVGLDHVEDPTQLMNPVATVPTFQAGDLAGLAVLGQGVCAPGV